MDPFARLSRGWWLPVAVLTCLAWSEARGARVAGRTQTGDGRPIRGVTVMLAPVPLDPPSNDRLAAQSDPQGLFHFDGLPPGGYLLRASKAGWADAEERIYVAPASADKTFEVCMPMELTLLRKCMAQLQVGLLVYAALFGLLVLAVSYGAALVPSRGLAAAGWGVIATSVLVALVKSLWTEAAILAGVGALGGAAITGIGRRLARRRIAAADAEVRRQDSQRAEERARLLALVGQPGRTLSDLRACGTAEFGGRVLDVRAFEGYIPRGSEVIVRSVEGWTLLVQLPPERAAAVPLGERTST